MASGRPGFEDKPPIQARTICRCIARDNKSLWCNKRMVSSSWWGIPYGMNSISNDHPSAYYHCDYKPFVCFIVALNLRGFNECWDVKPSPPRMGRSQGLFDVARAEGVVLFYTFLFALCEFVLITTLNYCQNYSWSVQGWQCKLFF